MFRVAESISLFPTQVWSFDVEPERWRPINEAVMGRVHEVLEELPRSSESYSSQSEPTLHENADMYDLNEIVIAAGNEVCREMEIIYERLLITSCWVNIGRPGVVHKEHAHPNNFLSVVFYVNVPVGGSSITFSDPRVQANVIVPRTRRVTPLTAKSVSLEAVTGRLLIFPAWLRHSVKANDSNELRVSISYDLQFDNYTLSMAPAMFPGNFRYNRT